MVMNPQKHPRGARPDFELPRPNPNPERMTDALWWVVCMREALEPELSQNGGTYADKPGYHNVGNNLPNHGEGNGRTDHSIRRAPDRRGPWWRTKCSAHDWTFLDAQRGRYGTISEYTNRRLKAMRDPLDLRPDNVFAYTLGQADGDLVVEGYNEYRDEAESSSDKTHLWHIHDSFRRDIIGNFWMMWRALTIDMGWTYAEWLRSTAEPSKGVIVATWEDTIKVSEQAGRELFNPDKPAGTEVAASTFLQIAAIWSRKAALDAAEIRAQLEAQATDLQEIKQALSRIEEQGRPAQ